MTTMLLVVGDKREYGTGSLYVGQDGCWWARWRTRDGRRPHRKLGPARTAGKRDGMTKREAEAKLRELILSDNSGERAKRGAVTVEQMGAAFVSRLKRDGRKPSHIESVEGHLRAHINPLLGHLSPAEVTERDVQRLVDRMVVAGRSPKTTRNVIGTLHSVMALAVRDRISERNPCQLADLPPAVKSAEIRFLTQAELERVLAAAPPADTTQAERDWWPVVRLLVLTAAMTGMRLGELRALRWHDLDMGATKVRVRQSFVRGHYGQPKSRHSVRAVPLASRLLAELEEHHKRTVWNQDADLVLAHPHTGRPLDRVRLLQHFKAALIRANVRPVRIHDLRHTFATTVAASGTVSLRTLQEWMGHLDARTTQIYADYMPGERESELLDAAFGGTIGQHVKRPGDESTAPGPGTEGVNFDAGTA